MQVFLSYAAEDRDCAEEIQLALQGDAHEVFFDRASLPAGQEFHSRIRDAIESCDVFVFLISPQSVANGSYARSELKFARTRWPDPAGHVLPVMARSTDFGVIPAYLRQVTVEQPEGNIAAEVLAKVAEMGPGRGADPLPSTTPSPAPSQPRHGRGNPGLVTLGAPSYQHNMPINSAQGLAPGLQILVPLAIAGAAGRTIQLIARFNYAGGPPLQANGLEPLYRDSGGQVATCTAQRQVAQAREAFTESSLGIPYFALNFPPTNGAMLHNLSFTVAAYLDQQPVGQSTPVLFQMRW